MALYRLRLVFGSSGSDGREKYDSHEIEASGTEEAIQLAKGRLADDDDRPLQVAMLFNDNGSVIWSLRAPTADALKDVSPAS